MLTPYPQRIQDRAIGSIISRACVDQMGQGFTHIIQVRNLLLNLTKMIPCNGFYIRAGPTLILIKLQQDAAVFDTKAQRP